MRISYPTLKLAHCGETEREQKAFAAILSLDTPCGQRGRKKLRTLSGAAATKCRKGRSKFHFRTMREGLLNDDVIEHGVAEIVAACVDLISEILLIHELSQSIQRHITLMESRFNESALTKVFRLRDLSECGVIPCLVFEDLNMLFMPTLYVQVTLCICVFCRHSYQRAFSISQLVPLRRRHLEMRKPRKMCMWGGGGPATGDSGFQFQQDCRSGDILFKP